MFADCLILWLWANSSKTVRDTLGLSGTNGTDLPEDWCCNRTAVASCNGSRVVKLIFSGSQLGVEVPYTFQNLTALTNFTARNSNLSGTLNSFPTSLCYLNLNLNNMSGNLSQIIRFNELTHFELRSNRFTGSVTDLPRELIYLSLDDNKFTGQLPEGLGNLIKLQKLDLGRNNFTGTVPSSFSRLSKLTKFAVSDNFLTGPVPSFFGKFSELEELYLSGNRFSGSITPSFLPASLSRLEKVYIGSNFITGRLPNISSLPNLQTFGFGCNAFSGPFPDLSNLPSLEWIFAEGNNFSGKFPQSLCSLPNLQKLNLGKNSFSGQLPPTLCAWKNLTVLHLEDNNFSGAVPAAVWRMQKLQYVNLSQNSFTSISLPDSLPKAMLALDLSNNTLRSSEKENLNLTFPHVKWIGLANLGMQGKLESVKLATPAVLEIEGNHFQCPYPVFDVQQIATNFSPCSVDFIRAGAYCGVFVCLLVFLRAVFWCFQLHERKKLLYLALRWGAKTFSMVFTINFLDQAMTQITALYHPRCEVVTNRNVFQNMMLWQLPEPLDASCCPTFPTWIQLWQNQGFGLNYSAVKLNIARFSFLCSSIAGCAMTSGLQCEPIHAGPTSSRFIPLFGTVRGFQTALQAFIWLFACLEAGKALLLVIHLRCPRLVPLRSYLVVSCCAPLLVLSGRYSFKTLSQKREDSVGQVQDLVVNTLLHSVPLLGLQLLFVFYVMRVGLSAWSAASVPATLFSTVSSLAMLAHKCFREYCCFLHLSRSRRIASLSELPHDLYHSLTDPQNKSKQQGTRACETDPPNQRFGQSKGSIGS